jgi:hypothetical protein
MTNLVETLRIELTAVEGDIPKLEAQAANIQARLRLTLEKAERIRALLAIYDEQLAPSGQSQLFATAPACLDASAAPTGSSSIRSKSAAVRAEITHLLTVRGEEHRQRILDHLIAKGLMGHEKNPLASLAAYLSDNKDLFSSDGRGNFSIRREPREPPPTPDVGAGSAEAAGQPAVSTPTDTTQEGELS